MLLVQGVCLVLFGLLILLVPRILVLLVATLFVVAGAGVVALALRLRRHGRSVRRVVDEFRIWFHGE